MPCSIDTQYCSTIQYMWGEPWTVWIWSWHFGPTSWWHLHLLFYQEIMICHIEAFSKKFCSYELNFLTSCHDGKMKLKQWYNFLLGENSGCSEEVPVLNIFTFLMEFYLENINDLIMEIGPWLNATESRGNAQSATHTQAANSTVKIIPWQT